MIKPMSLHPFVLVGHLELVDRSAHYKTGFASLTRLDLGIIDGERGLDCQWMVWMGVSGWVDLCAHIVNA